MYVKTCASDAPKLMLAAFMKYTLQMKNNDLYFFDKSNCSPIHLTIMKFQKICYMILRLYLDYLEIELE